MGRGSRSHCQRECTVCHKGVAGGGVGKGPSRPNHRNRKEGCWRNGRLPGVAGVGSVINWERGIWKISLGSVHRGLYKARMLSLDLWRGNIVMRLRAWFWSQLEFFPDQPLTSCVTLGEFLTSPETQCSYLWKKMIVTLLQFYFTG